MRIINLARWIVLFSILSISSEVYSQAISPTDYMGRAPGTDFELADWKTLSGWFDQFGEKTATAQTQTVAIKA